MKNKKIISLIASTLTVITLTGCNFGKNNINKEDKQKQETQIQKQKENTELDKKSNEETDDKKNIEKEKKDIKKSESEKDKINTESKKENKPDDSSKAKVDGKKKSNQPKPPEKPKYQEKREYKKEIKKEYPKQSSNINLKPKEKKEPVKKNIPIKENIPVPKKSIVTPKENIPQAPKQTSDVFISEIEQTIFRKVNEERRKLGIAPLAYNYTMQKYARDKSLDMGSKNYFSHEDLRGKLITENMKRDGVSFNAWGENIAYVAGYTGNANISNQFMTRWMNSTGHRKNILSQNFKSIGIGVYKIGNKYYATQEFYR